MLSRLLLIGMFVLTTIAVQAQFPCLSGQIAIAPGTPTDFCFTNVNSIDVRVWASPSALPNAFVVVNEANEIVHIGNANDISLDATGEIYRIYSFTFTGAIIAQVGDNLDDVDLATACYALSSNFIEINTNGGNDGGTLEGGPFTFCVGDGEADMIPDGAITVSGAVGSNTAWVVTDADGNILGLPANYSDVDFDGAGTGECLVWYLSFEDGLEGAEVGANAADLMGCYDLSNPISVFRNQPNGGTLEGGPFTFCVGDGESDMLEPGSITLTGNSGSNSQWVVTDADGNILGLPPMPGAVNFDDAGPGECLIWHLSFEDGLEGAEVGANAADLMGCYDLSNPISVFRNQPNGGTLEGGPFTFCVGDGESDMLEPGSITLTGNSGSNSQWVVTDADGNILGLPPMPGAVNFDDAGPGECLIWHLSFEDGLEGAEVGANAADLVGCYDLSNPISVFRNQPNGGIIYTGTDEGPSRVVVANRASGTISVIDSDQNTVIATYQMPDDGEPMYVVYNSSNQTVLVGDYNGKVVAFDAISFEITGQADAGAGVFHMWGSPDNTQLWVNNELDRTISVINPTTLENIATVELPSDLFDEGYKPHDVIVMPNNAAAFVTLIGGGDTDYVIKYDASTFMETARVAVGADPHVSLTSENDKLYVASQGAGELKVLNRSDLSEVTVLSIPNAHGLGMNGDGTFLYIGNIANGGSMATYTLDLATNMLVGDPVDAPFSAPHNYAIAGENELLYLTHSGPSNDQVSVYTLDTVPTLLTSLTVENNPFGLVAYTVTTTTEVEICAGDGVSDAFDVTLEGASGSNSQWVITDDSLNILALPAGPPFDLEGAGAGICLIWHLSFEDGLEGAEVGANAADLTGCFDLSNSISVLRTEVNGGEVETETGETEIDVIVGDSLSDIISFESIGAVGPKFTFVVTDDQNNILAIPDSSVVDFEGAGAGVCRVWGLAYSGEIIAGMGDNAGTVALTDSCFSLSSNFVTVTRAENLQGGGNNGVQLRTAVAETLLDAKIFPNPAVDELRLDIRMREVVDAEIQILVLSLDGKILEQRIVPTQTQTVLIDISKLESGTYFVRINTDKELLTKRFVKVVR